MHTDLDFHLLFKYDSELFGIHTYVVHIYRIRRPNFILQFINNNKKLIVLTKDIFYFLYTDFDETDADFENMLKN